MALGRCWRRWRRRPEDSVFSRLSLLAWAELPGERDRLCDPFTVLAALVQAMTSSFAPSLPSADLALLPPGTPSRRPGARRFSPDASGPSGRALSRRNDRVMSYRQLVRPLAVHYARQCQESCEDLIQVGLLGLIRAAELYDGKRQTPFDAFARPHIRGAILHYLRDAAPSVRLPRRQAELQSRLRRLQESCRETAGHPGSADRLCRALGLNQQQWNLLEQQRQLSRPCSLSSVPVEQLSETSSIAAPPWAADPSQGPLDNLALVDLGPASGIAMGVEEMLGLLEPQQGLVVRQVVLAGWSYRRLAEQLNVSPMTVQRQLRRGLARLREELERAGSPLGSFRPGSDPVPSAVPGC